MRPAMAATRRSLDMTAYAVMLVCTLLWGLQQVTVKGAAAGVWPVMQGGIRSVLAAALMVAVGIALVNARRG
jgi:hypothetical protein